ncbi:hypothetical protein [Streptomyces sp. NBC_00470]|uniref:hypothetical protein n=1 Tax=Streptomyces sp. NBC_00470 TaxID=2975753 RepID=UPI002F911231
MAFGRRSKTSSSDTSSEAPPSGFTAEQRAGQDRLNAQLSAARNAPREGREPKEHERTPWGRR